MRALFLSNFYPPCGQGGYELWCQEVAEGLRRHGHEVLVVTSRHHREHITQPEPTWIQRQLHLEMELKSLRNGIQFFTHRRMNEQENIAYLQESVNTFRPDVVLVWGMWNLSRTLPVLIETLLPQRVVYYMGDYWPTLASQLEMYWQTPARDWKTWLPKNLLGLWARRILAHQPLPVPDFDHVIFPTRFMREELKRMGMPTKCTKIIYGAADTRLYADPEQTNGLQPGRPLALLYAGRIRPDKGVHVAIEAVGLLVNQFGLSDLVLKIVGDGEADYAEELRQLVSHHQIESFVHFCGAQPKEEMPRIYRQADIFLFTSIWPEPFGRVLIEAMAAGAVVIGSPTGGAAEILVDEENALTFPPGDAEALAKQIMRLANASALYEHLIEAGQRTAREKFDAARMTQEIEAYLQAVAQHN